MKTRVLSIFLFLSMLQILHAQPANDLCTGAIPITPSAAGTGCTNPAFILPFSSDGTTDSGVPQVCFANPGNDQWFTWTATADNLLYRGRAPGFSNIAIFSSCADANSGIEIDCFDSSFDTSRAVVLTGWMVGDDLLIQIYNRQGVSSNAAFCLEEPVALPITLRSFEIEQLEEANLVTWVTSSELNTESHQIERSADGKNWKVIGQVDAIGFSDESQRYAFTDDHPLPSAYYRLKSVDFDHSYQFSKVINVKRAMAELSLSNLFPSPAKQNLTIVFNNPQSHKVTIQVSDLMGRILFQVDQGTTDEVNRYDMSIAHLNAGVYFIRLNNGYSQVTKQFVKFEE